MASNLGIKAAFLSFLGMTWVFGYDYQTVLEGI